MILKRIRNSFIVDFLRESTFIRKVLRNTKMIFLRQLYGLKNVHHSFYIGGKADISSDLTAGAYSFVSINCRICPNVSIGKYTMLASDVQILGEDHVFDNSNTPIIFSGRPNLPFTIIGDDVWIGARAIIKAGVTIGDGAIIAAGSVVTKDVPARKIYGGVPAKFIKNRFLSESEEKNHMEMLIKDVELLYNLPKNRT